MFCRHFQVIWNCSAFSSSRKTDPREILKHKIRPLVTPIEQTYESFVLRVLSELLVEGPSAPFYQALIESGLGQAFSPVTGKLLSILRV